LAPGVTPSPGTAGLTGWWSGEYWYLGMSFPTPFTAHIDDHDGALSGSTLEPNTFADASLAELSADLFGDRRNFEVRFIKRYHRAPGVHALPIAYVGVANADFTLVEGDWSFSDTLAPRGRFMLARVARGMAAVSLEAAATVGARR
jgi:hypothetical protein